MIKKTLLTLSLCALVGLISAQSLRFEKDGVTFPNNQIIVLTEPTNAFGEMQLELQLRNLSNEALDVVVEKEHVSIVEGTENSICWGSCFDPSVFISPYPVTIEAGSLSDPGMLSFHYQLDPTYTGQNLIPGTTVVKYHAYPERNPDDRATIEVHYSYNDEGIVENDLQVSKAYPNPATSQINFDFKGNGFSPVKAVLYNLLGQEVDTRVINNTQGKITFSLDGFQPGIYFCSFFVNDEMIRTEKFIVKK